MSKILICPDIHYCTNSSIIRSKGNKYSTRIENCIKSINWLENLAVENSCDSIIYLGDFFDKNILNSEELTSLNELKFANLQHYCLVGNHEISITNNKFSSMHILNNINNFQVIDTESYLDKYNNVYIHFLPYSYDCLEDISEIIDFSDTSRKHIVLSHNDIKGIQYGKFTSTNGLSIESINKNCDLFINGHLHNNTWVDKKILNLGILTGQNFSEDANLYSHYVAILDTDKFELELVENPYAFNFYKIDILNKKDINKLKLLKNNAVISIRCISELYNEVKELIANNQNIIESKTIIIKDIVSKEELEEKIIEDLSIDHLNKFREFCLEKIDNTDTLVEELLEVCKCD